MFFNPITEDEVLEVTKNLDAKKSTGHDGFSILIISPRLTKLFFVTRLTKGGGVVTTPSLDFPNRTPYEIDFGINR